MKISSILSLPSQIGCLRSSQRKKFHTGEWTRGGGGGGEGRMREGGEER